MKISTTAAVAFAALVAAPSVSATSLRNLGRWDPGSQKCLEKPDHPKCATDTDGEDPTGGTGGGGGGPNGLYEVQPANNIYYTHQGKMCSGEQVAYCYNITAAATNETTCDIPMAICETEGSSDPLDPNPAFSCHANKEEPEAVLDLFDTVVNETFEFEEHGAPDLNITGNGCCMTLETEQLYCKKIGLAVKCDVAGDVNSTDIDFCLGKNNTDNSTIADFVTAGECGVLEPAECINLTAINNEDATTVTLKVDNTNDFTVSQDESTSGSGFKSVVMPGFMALAFMVRQWN